MHDEYFILRKNGHYSIKMLLMGMIGMPDSQHGRYLISSDTVYFVKKSGKKTFHTYAYGIIDSLAGEFSYYPDNNNTEPSVFRFLPKPPVSAADK